MRNPLVLATFALLLLAAPATAHEGGYYASAPSIGQYFTRTPLRPYGAYDGLTIRFVRVNCKGIPRQAPGETSPPTLHRPNATLYKHARCFGADLSGRVWSWVAHVRKLKIGYSYLECDDRYSDGRCPKR